MSQDFKFGYLKFEARLVCICPSSRDLQMVACVKMFQDIWLIANLGTHCTFRWQSLSDKLTSKLANRNSCMGVFLFSFFEMTMRSECILGNASQIVMWGQKIKGPIKNLRYWPFIWMKAAIALMLFAWRAFEIVEFRAPEFCVHNQRAVSVWTWLQMKAEAQAKQADTKVRHLQKQIAEQRKMLKSKQKEADTMQSSLAKEQAAVASCEQRYALLVIVVKVLNFKASQSRRQDFCNLQILNRDLCVIMVKGFAWNMQSHRVEFAFGINQSCSCNWFWKFNSWLHKSSWPHLCWIFFAVSIHSTSECHYGTATIEQHLRPCLVALCFSLTHQLVWFCPKEIDLFFILLGSVFRLHASFAQAICWAMLCSTYEHSALSKHN